MKNFDYNTVGVYFITICTKNRRCLLSRIVGTGVLDCPQVELTESGKIAEKYINQLNGFYEHISVESYVIMPNHIHLLLFIKENGQSRTPVPTSRIKIVFLSFAAKKQFSQFTATIKAKNFSNLVGTGVLDC
ncbi:MAG: hypothetical protein IJ938_02015, partial [Clostridia bacterium]|nr:hypothetical protein [Clostridia bacterium]